jgi:hypothetical protein
MPILALIELFLAIIAIIIGFAIVMGGLVMLEILYYVNGLELAAWQEWAFVLILPYVLFRVLYFFVKHFKFSTDY